MNYNPSLHFVAVVPIHRTEHCIFIFNKNNSNRTPIAFQTKKGMAISEIELELCTSGIDHKVFKCSSEYQKWLND